MTVLDSNDNTPIFQFDNDLSLMHYYAGVSSEASAFTKVLTVKVDHFSDRLASNR